MAQPRAATTTAALSRSQTTTSAISTAVTTPPRPTTYTAIGLGPERGPFAMNVLMRCRNILPHTVQSFLRANTTLDILTASRPVLGVPGARPMRLGRSIVAR